MVGEINADMFMGEILNGTLEDMGIPVDNDDIVNLEPAQRWGVTAGE